MNTKSGLFNITAAAVRKIGLKPGDQVSLFQDEENPRNWYIKVVQENGLLVRLQGNGDTTLSFNASQFAREIAASVGMTKRAGGMKIGELIETEPGTKVWELITGFLARDQNNE